MTGPKTHKTRFHGLNFGRSAELYDRVRPGYPDEVIEQILQLGSGTIADVGAGTGKLGGELQARGRTVIAIDPDAELLRLNPCKSLVGSAEALPLADGSADIVTAAQAWHWFDPTAASAEIARVLRPGGQVAIVINQLDVRIDWVMRLARITHAGDVYRPAWRPELGAHFSPPELTLVEFTQPMTPVRMRELAASRSYWLRSGEKERARITRNLEDYLTRENPLGEHFELPYLSLLYTAQKR